jgi:hypothetical protein
MDTRRWPCGGSVNQVAVPVSPPMGAICLMPPCPSCPSCPSCPRGEPAGAEKATTTARRNEGLAVPRTHDVGQYGGSVNQVAVPVSPRARSASCPRVPPVLRVHRALVVSRRVRRRPPRRLEGTKGWPCDGHTTLAVRRVRQSGSGPREPTGAICLMPPCPSCPSCRSCPRGFRPTHESHHEDAKERRPERADGRPTTTRRNQGNRQRTMCQALPPPARTPRRPADLVWRARLQ